MKRVLSFFVLSALLFLVPSTKIASASTIKYLEDNYNAYLVAVGEIDDNDCLTEYYTKVSDGNAVVTFDLLYRSENGYFGLIAGKDTTLGNLSTMTDYMFFGKNTLSSTSSINNDNLFLAKNTYRITFDNTNSKWIVERKAITETDEKYQEVLSLEHSFISSNIVGLACYTNESNSSTAVIDNLVITDLNGKTKYVSNKFNGTETIKDGNMVSLVTNSTTGTKLYTGSVYIQKTHTCTVRFMSENGEIISEQNVSIYGTATAPEAPQKEGYVLDYWSGDFTRIIQDCTFYPTYKVGEKGTDEKQEDKGGTSEDDSTQKSGCFGEICFSSVFLTGFMFAVVIVLNRRKHHENIK